MSFFEDIEKLAQPFFRLPDLEEEDVDGSSSNAASKVACAENDNAPKLKRKAIAFSFDDNSKYSGTKVSRGDIFDNFSGVIGLAGRHATGNGHDKSDSADADKKFEDEKNKKKNSTTEEKGSNDDEGIDEVEDLESEEVASSSSVGDCGNGGDDDENSNNNTGSEENDENLQAFTNGNLKAVTLQDLMKGVDQAKQQRKAESVRTQLELWEKLLYVKIKIHAALTAFNQLPRGQLAKDLLKGAEADTLKNLKLAKKNSLKLLSSFLEAERLLFQLSSFTKSTMAGNKEAEDSDDEEIESSEDEKGVEEEDHVDGGEKDDERSHDFEATRAQFVDIKSLSKNLCEREEIFNKFRETTLLKWDERTKLISSRRLKNANSDFTAFEHENITTQIEKAEEDEEIFDDDDFYQMLLKELIDKKTSNTQDPIAMTRHYIEMQKLKSRRMKKKYVDHRASKDRKIKYLPIPKLVNFHPAMPELIEWSHESRNELFKSLFS